VSARLAHFVDVLILLAGFALVGWVGVNFGRATAPAAPCHCYIKQPGLALPPQSFTT
jgi:hypothetical protein